MDDAPQRPKKNYPLSPAKMSKTPSWVMLGFVLGALTVASMPPLKKEKRVPPASPTITAKSAGAAKAEGPRQPRQLSEVEAVFELWGKGAVWDLDTTEVALWNAQTGGFTDFYEVMRYADRYYFRSIPTLTRRPITRGKHIPDCPLLFTETEEQYQEWLKHGRSERPFGDFGPPRPGPASAQEPRTLPAVPSPKIAPPKFEELVPFEPPATPRLVPAK